MRQGWVSAHSSHSSQHNPKDLCLNPCSQHPAEPSKPPRHRGDAEPPLPHLVLPPRARLSPWQRWQAAVRDRAPKRRARAPPFPPVNTDGKI